MKKFYFFSLSLSLFLLSFNSFAQSDEFYGVKINAPLTMQACPSNIENIKQACVQYLDKENSGRFVRGVRVQTAKIYYPSGKEPEFAIDNYIWASLIGGKVVRLDISTRGLSVQRQFNQALIEKLGEPTVTLIVERGNPAGYRPGAIMSNWTSRNGLSAAFIGDDSSGKGHFVVSSDDSFNQQNQHRGGTPM